MSNPPQRSQVFFSYSHKDKKWLEPFQASLRPIIRANQLSVWDDTKIKAGDIWRDEIKQALASAKVAVLLVSMNFLNSDFIAENELPPLLEAAQNEGLKILLVVVGHSLFAETELGRYQAVNDPSRPLGSVAASTREKEIVRICLEIKKAVILETSIKDAAVTSDTPAKGAISSNRLKTQISPEDTSEDFTVFISYAHSDNESFDPAKRWLNRLSEQLQPLVLQDKMVAWSDAQLEAGELWNSTIKTQLQNARVAVLLVSPALLASKYMRNSELPVLLMNAMNEGRTVIPIIVRSCLFTETKFKYPDPTHGPSELSLSIFQSANPPSKPLNSVGEHEQDAVLVSVTQRILKLARQH